MAQRRNINCAYFILIGIALVSPIAADDCCQPGDTKPDESDCTKYYACCTGQFVQKSCPGGQYWDSKKESCEIDNGQCGSSSCKEGETQTDAADCTKYLICKNGAYVSASCNSGFYWDSASSSCALDIGQCKPSTCTDGKLEVDAGDCAGYLECVDNKLVKRKCVGQTYFDKTLLACVVDSEGVCVSKVCDPECCDAPNDWLGPVDKNCSAFIHCLYGKAIEQVCPNNLQFNSNTQQCDFPDVVRCDDGSPPPSGPTAGPSGTYCQSGGRCVGQPDGAMFANDQNGDCGAYVVCQCECEIDFVCPAGLVFNAKVRSCDWPENVNA